MVGILVSANYKYKDVKLASGVTVSATGVTIKDGKVVRVENGVVTIGEDENRKEFTFSVYGDAENLTYSTSSVPSDYNGQDIAEEFVAFVETDIV